MSQQNDDDLARASDGPGDSKPKSPAAPQRPAAKIPQIKIQQAPAKEPPAAAARPAQPAVRPAQPQPGARPASPAGKGIPMPRNVARPASAPAQRGARAASPLDAPAALASVMDARPSATKPSAKKPTGNTLARTIIPILLTLGLIQVALCVVRFQWKSIDNPTLDTSPWVAWMIGGFGVLLWAFAALLMASVARQIKAAAAISLPATAPAVPAAQKPPSRAARPD